MIAPIVIVTILMIYYICIGCYFAYMEGVPTFAKILALLIPGILSGVSIAVLVQRIKEIKQPPRRSFGRDVRVALYVPRIVIQRDLLQQPLHFLP